jgi:hypothetical protein
MHFVHITPEDIKNNPWLGLLIGLIGITFFTVISYNAAKDYVNFSKQQLPESLDIEKLETDYPFTKKWVTITNFHLNCEVVEKTRRTDPLEKLIEGPVYDTYTVMTDNSGKELIVTQFHGDIFCPYFQNRPLTGVLTATDDFSYGFAFLSTKLSKATNVSLILHVDEGLMPSKFLLSIGLVFDSIFLSLILYSSRLWLKKWEARFVQL